MTDRVNTNAQHVRSTGRLLCGSVGDVEILRSHITEHIIRTTAEPGCVAFNVFQSDDPLIWHVEECFVDKEAFEFHQQRTRASTWWMTTVDILRDYEISGL
jgi:quinol monooxygenase YgiN